MNATPGSHSNPYPTAIAALDVTRRGIAALPTETVPITDAAGRVLREPVLADRALPACDRSRMDGYALRSNEYRADTAMPVSGEVRAGDDGRISVPPGACVKIATGAPIPDGLDVVIEHERSDRADPVRFTL